MDFKPRDTAYLNVSNIRIQKVTVLSVSGGFVTVRFADTFDGGTRVREKRLFKTEAEAMNALGLKPPPSSGGSNPWQYL